MRRAGSARPQLARSPSRRTPLAHPRVAVARDRVVTATAFELVEGTELVGYQRRRDICT